MSTSGYSSLEIGPSIGAARRLTIGVFSVFAEQLLRY
jgi:hypothetical protein